MSLSLVIYQLDDVKEIKGLKEQVELLDKMDLKIKKYHVPAVAGEFAGMALEFLISDKIIGILTLIEIGRIVFDIIKKLNEFNKKFTINKKLTKALTLFKISKNDGKEIKKLECSKIWGPMVVGHLEFPSTDFHFPETPPCEGYGNFMGVTTPYRVIDGKKISRTTYYMIDEKGDILIKWSTQTYNDNLPDLFKLS